MISRKSRTGTFTQLVWTAYKRSTSNNKKQQDEHQQTTEKSNRGGENPKKQKKNFTIFYVENFLIIRKFVHGYIYNVEL